MPDQPSLLPSLVEPIEQPDKDWSVEQRQFEFALKDLPFGDVYAAMIEQGFRWREAAFVAWAILPKEQRVPKTKGELGALLGCSGAKISAMEGDRRLMTMRLKFAQLAYVDHLPDIIAASVEVASKPSYKATSERNNIINKVLGMGTEHIQVNVGQGEAANFDEMSDEELAALAADAGADDE